MRIAVLATLAAATLAVAIYLLLGTHEAEPVAASPAAARPPEPGPAPGPMAPAHPARPPVVAAPEPGDELPPQPAVVERPFVAPSNAPDPETLDLRLRELPRQLLDAVAPCGAGEADGDGSIDLNYTLVASGGQIQIEEVQQLDSTLADARLEHCIAGKLADTSWDDPGFPDTRQAGRLTVTRHDLARRQ